MRRRPMFFSSFSLAAFDIALFHLAIILAFLVRSNLEIFDVVEISNLRSYLELFPWISLIVPFVFFYMDLYDTGSRKRFANFVYSIAISVVFVNVIMMACAFWNRSFAFPRTVLVLSIALQFALILTYRYALWMLIKKNHGTRSVLVVTHEQHTSLRLANKILEHDDGWFKVGSFITPELLFANPQEMERADIVLIGTDISPEKQHKLVDLAVKSGKEAMIVPDSYHIFLHNSNPQQIADTFVLSIQPQFLTRRQQYFKRAFDAGFSFVMLILLIPVMVAIWSLVRITSSGPALYKQERVGLHGRKFVIYKFRSMVHNAEESTGPVLAKEGDERITYVGRIMRAMRLDELPQLFNVLRGDMSLVGPRPEREVFTKEYEAKIPDFGYRVSVKPGITGLAQVLSNYNTSMEDKVRYDLLYGYNYSFLLDLKILFQTIRVILQRDSVRGVRESSDVEGTFGKLGLADVQLAASKSESS